MSVPSTGVAASVATPWRGVIEEFRPRLPVTAATPVVTLHEGGTPLVPAAMLSRRTGCEVWLKVEGMNPTGSFKDRGMSLAVAKAAESGAQVVLCASTGNTSSSAAAYAARAGLVCAVLVPRGRVAPAKLAQALAYGARVLEVDGSFDDCLVVARRLADRSGVVLVNSVNPHRIQGQKTIAFEIVAALGRAPHVHCLPVGNAGNITAHWLGYTEEEAPGSAPSRQHRPRMWGFQAAGAAPFVHGAAVTDPQTVASAIRIGAPASWEPAIHARDESGGLIEAVADEAIIEACRLLAATEGVHVEPASAAGVAGLLRLHGEGRLAPDQVVVCTLTGHGLKDSAWATQAGTGSEPIPPDAHAAAAALGL